MIYEPSEIKYQYIVKLFLFAVLYEARRNRYKELPRLGKQEEQLKTGAKKVEYSIQRADKIRMRLLSCPDDKEYDAKKDDRAIRNEMRGRKGNGVIYKLKCGSWYRLNQLPIQRTEDKRDMRTEIIVYSL